MNPRRIQLSRAKDWRIPAGAVKVDRSTGWGNPYRAWRDLDGKWYVSNKGEHHPADGKAEAQALSVELFRQMAAEQSAHHFKYGAYPAPVDIIKHLRGKDLACWCKPGTPCHADVLIEIANAQAHAKTRPEKT